MSSPSVSPVLWETVKCDLKGLFPEDVFNAWFEPIVAVESGEESLVLGVPNEFAVIWVHENYLDLITQRVRLTCRLPSPTPCRARGWSCRRARGLRWPISLPGTILSAAMIATPR
jgi:hypothetical protein